MNPIDPRTLILLEFCICAISMIGQHEQSNESKCMEHSIRHIITSKSYIQKKRSDGRNMGKMDLAGTRGHTSKKVIRFLFL